MTVNADLLPILARETAIDASRYMIVKMNNLPYFFRIGMDRRRVISEISERYRENTSYLQEIVSVGLPSADPPQQLQQQPLPPQNLQSPIIQTQGMVSPVLPAPQQQQTIPPQRLPPQPSIPTQPPQKLVLPPQQQQQQRPYPGQSTLGKVPLPGVLGAPSTQQRMYYLTLKFVLGNCLKE